jgi:ribosomal protein S18 acetylase RimI-like enzyme
MLPGTMTPTTSPRTCLVTRREELEQILQLQAANLRDHVSPEQAAREGFVTVAHTLDVLERMHALAPSVIAKDGEKLVGYALVMPVEARAFVPILEPMFQLLETLSWRGRPLREYRSYVMGQVCVAEEYRGQGVFDALYREHRASYGARFDCTVTEVATRNTRSMRAHTRVGFEVIETYRDATDEWAVIALGLRDGPR